MEGAKGTAGIGKEGGREGGKGWLIPVREDTNLQPTDLALPRSLPPSLPSPQLQWTDPTTGACFWVPRLTFTAVASYTQNKTQQYDEEATAHLL